MDTVLDRFAGVTPHALWDTVMLNRMKQIIQERGIKVLIETGVDKGLSTVTLSKIVDRVIGVDNNSLCIVTAQENLQKAGVNNVILLWDNSPDALRKLSPLLPDDTFYFLDAHWQNYWPILDEIAQIRRGTGVIMFHDMVVPGHPELGFDVYHGQPLNYAYVKPALDAWSSTHRIEYNETADCPMPRGIGYVFPK